MPSLVELDLSFMPFLVNYAMCNIRLIMDAMFWRSYDIHD
jgi:hypothetical protein